MYSTDIALADQLDRALGRELLRLAKHEEEAAAHEAQGVHYWEPVPVTVAVHRQCAAALRVAARELSTVSPGGAAR